MDDVNPQAPAAPAATVEETTQVEPQQPNQTPVTPEVPATETPAERTIPYGRFSEVNKSLKETQRQLAELKKQGQYSQFDTNDVNAVMSHPIVQELLIKQAKSELTDYAKDYMEAYPQINPQVKKAILSNVRGFVKETTTDVESAKLDIADYIEGILEGEAQKPVAAKNFPVASTNAPTVTQTTKPADVEKILSKPVTEWTDEETKTVEDYSKSLPKK